MHTNITYDGMNVMLTTTMRSQSDGKRHRKVNCHNSAAGSTDRPKRRSPARTRTPASRRYASGRAWAAGGGRAVS